MKILAILKNPVYFDDGLLVCENVQSYKIDNEKGFLEIHYRDKNYMNYMHVSLDEIVYFRILSRG